MGIYYKLVNVENKERIEPSKIGNGAIKIYQMVFSPICDLFFWLTWNSEHWELVSDQTDLYYDCTRPGKDFLVDATEKYCKEFEENFKVDIRHKGK